MTCNRQQDTCHLPLRLSRIMRDRTPVAIRPCSVINSTYGIQIRKIFSQIIGLLSPLRGLGFYDRT